MSPHGPFFLVGFQRSGTTLLRLMMNAHPEIGIPHDSAELWLRYRKQLDKYDHLRTVQSAIALIQDLLAEPRIEAWQTPLPKEALLSEPLPTNFPAIMDRFHQVYVRFHGKKFWGDKNTGNLTELDQLNVMFPACKIIHLIRDGRDCALSHGSEEYVYGYENVLRVAKEWKNQVTLCRKMGAMLPSERFYELRYEDLITNSESELKGVCDFLQISFSPRMLNYYKDVKRHVPEGRRSLWPLLDKPPVTSNAFKWKSSMKLGDLAVFERVAGSLLEEVGYERLNQRPTGGVVREFLYEIDSSLSWRLQRIRSFGRRKTRAGENRG